MPAIVCSPCSSVIGVGCPVTAAAFGSPSATSGRPGTVAVYLSGLPGSSWLTSTSGRSSQSICSRSAISLNVSSTTSPAASSQRCSAPYVRSYSARGAFPGRKPGIFACCTCRWNARSVARSRRSASTSTLSDTIEPGLRSTACVNERTGVVVGGSSVMESTSLRLPALCCEPPMYFYEIHEGDDDIGTAVLVAHADRFAPDEFFRMVKRAKELVKDSFEEASLAEAIANERERSSAFVHVTDERLLASVNVGETDADTYLVATDEGVRTVYVEGDEPKPNGDRPN